MTKVQDTPEVKKEPKQVQKWFYVNLVLFVIFVGGSSVWLLHYTDSFETVGGLVALVGALSWLGFVSKVLPEELLTNLQWTFVGMFSKRWIAPLMGALVLVLGGASLLFGTIRVELRRENAARFAFIYKSAEELGEPVSLSPTSSTSIIKPAAFWSGSAYRIKVPGFASQTVTFFPWWLTNVYVPHFFNRKIYLVRASQDLIPSIGSAKVPIKVSILDAQEREIKSETIPEYTGYSFWVNCTDDVEIPASKQTQIESDFPKDAPVSTFRALWLAPRALKWGDLDLAAGTQIRVAQIVADEKNRLFGDKTTTVNQAGSLDNAVEVILLGLKNQ